MFSGQGGKGASDGEQGAPRGERQGGEQLGRGDHRAPGDASLPHPQPEEQTQTEVL